MDWLQHHPGQEAATIDLRKAAAACANWPTRQRRRARKRLIPRADVEGGLKRTGKGRAPCPRGPACFLVRFVSASGLSCRDGQRQVFRRLPPYRRAGPPRRTTPWEARQRLGGAPMRRPAEPVIRRRGKPTTPGASSRGRRTLARDGFVVDVAETPANARACGRPGRGRAPAAAPRGRVLSLGEAGRHVRCRARITPPARGEVTMAHPLPRSWQEDMLLRWHRNSLSDQTVAEGRPRRAHRLARIASDRLFEPTRGPGDGSDLAQLDRRPAGRRKDRDGILVRIIASPVEAPGRPGAGAVPRPLTTPPDEALAPAETVIVLDPERWEEGRTIDEVKAHRRERPVLRGRTPAGAVQELSGLRPGPYVIRVLRPAAAAEGGIAPQRTSFTGALTILRCRLPGCPTSRRGRRRWYRELVAEIAEEVLEGRRDRINPRVIRRRMSRWRKERPAPRHDPQPTRGFAEPIVMRR